MNLLTFPKSSNTILLSYPLLDFNRSTASFALKTNGIQRSWVACYDQKLHKCKVDDKKVLLSRRPEPEGEWIDWSFEEEEDDDDEESVYEEMREEKLAEELEELENEVMDGRDEGREATDYDRRAQIFDESSRVFQAIKNSTGDNNRAQ